MLIVEDDSATGLIVLQLLLDEGYAASLLSIASSDTFRAAVGRLEPDCILLDSGAGSEYGAAWLEAVWSYTRRPPVPVVMFTAQHSAAEEVAAQPTERSAAIFAVVAKPFDIDELLETVASTVGAVARFDHRRSRTWNLRRLSCSDSRRWAPGMSVARQGANGSAFTRLMRSPSCSGLNVTVFIMCCANPSKLGP
ncbi:MAG: response regulator [Chloroflexi bacterium]|nr:response regulator [Chloroflexota bacterium]MBV9596669.1 response regulator [Chloroflexota bacterium]